MRDFLPRIDLPAFVLLTTPLMFLIFIGIVVWSMQRGRKENYEVASKLPLNED